MGIGLPDDALEGFQRSLQEIDLSTTGRTVIVYRFYEDFVHNYLLVDN